MASQPPPWERYGGAAPGGQAPPPVIQGPPRQPTPRNPEEVRNTEASTQRTQALTPEELEALRLQNEERRRGLKQGVNESQERQQQLSRTIADIEAMTGQLQRVGDLYNQNFRNSDPMISLGLSETEREFDRNAQMLRQQAQGAFRIPGVGSTSDYDARLLEQAYGLTSQNWDTENEAILDGLARRLNARREALGLPPVDWRQSEAPAPANPNLVQPGESMGRVGNLPPITDFEREQAGGQNQLDNSGGLYATDEDRALANEIAGRATGMARAGASPEQINAYLNSVGRQPLTSDQVRVLNSFRRANQSRRHPGFSPTVNPTGRSDPNLVTGAANTGVGAGVIASGDAMSFGLLDNLTADPERTRAGMELIRERHPVASVVGEAAGSLLPGAMAERAVGAAFRGVNALRGGEATVARLGNELSTIGEMSARPLGNALYGGAYGAGSADEGSRFLGAARGALFSAAGGEVGDRLTAGVGRVATGARNAGTRYLNERGIPMTVGQIAGRGGLPGRALSRIENALESLPVLGAAIRSRRLDSFQATNRAAFDEALEPVGASTGGLIGEVGAETARTAVSGAYDEALNGVNVRPDRRFIGEMRKALTAGQQLPDDLRPHFMHFVENRLPQALDGGRLSGTAYQAIRQELRQARQAARGQLSEAPFVSAIRQLETTLEGLIRRRAPGANEALTRADRAYRRTRVVEGAVGRAINNSEQGGVFTPAQLGLEARGNARRFSGDEATTNRPFYELQRETQNILPSNVPNSGTVDRQWVLAAFPALAAGGAELSGVADPKTAALFGALGLPYTRRGQQLFQKLLVSRPETVRRAGEAIIAQRRFGARAGAGAVNPVTDQTQSPTGR